MLSGITISVVMRMPEGKRGSLIWVPFSQVPRGNNWEGFFSVLVFACPDDKGVIYERDRFTMNLSVQTSCVLTVSESFGNRPCLKASHSVHQVSCENTSPGMCSVFNIVYILADQPCELGMPTETLRLHTYPC